MPSKPHTYLVRRWYRENGSQECHDVLADIAIYEEALTIAQASVKVPTTIKVRIFQFDEQGKKRIVHTIMGPSK